MRTYTIAQESQLIVWNNLYGGGGEWLYLYVGLIHFAIHLKIIQHCKINCTSIKLIFLKERSKEFPSWFSSNKPY